MSEGDDYMEKITYNMLDEFGPVIKGTFRLLYPQGLTLAELEQKANEYHWLRSIFLHFKGA